MADDSLDAQLRRLAAIVAALAETANQHDARIAEHHIRLARLDAIIERLDRLIAEVFRDRANGQHE